VGVLRWLADPQATVAEAALPAGARPARDMAGLPVILFPDEWFCRYVIDRDPEVPLSALPPCQVLARPVVI
jgi:hypothetical protein